jgi:hypothetical protein
VLKKTITYKDFNDVEQSDEFHFHLSAEKLLELEATLPGGFEEYVERIMKSGDGAQILELFKRLIRYSIGHVSDDGKRFVQTEEITNNFVQTNAYTKLFLELGSSEELAAQFFTAIIPKDLAAQAEAMTAGGSDSITRQREMVESTPTEPERGITEKYISYEDAQQLDKKVLDQMLKDGWIVQRPVAT